MRLRKIQLLKISTIFFKMSFLRVPKVLFGVLYSTPIVLQISPNTFYSKVKILKTMTLQSFQNYFKNLIFFRKITTRIRKFLQNIWDSLITSIFGARSQNSMGKNMCTLKYGIFRNNGWGKFPKIYVIHLFSKFLGNIPCFFWNLSILCGKSSNSLGKSVFTLKCGIFPNNGWGKFHKFFSVVEYIFSNDLRFYNAV